MTRPGRSAFDLIRRQVAQGSGHRAETPSRLPGEQRASEPSEQRRHPARPQLQGVGVDQVAGSVTAVAETHRRGPEREHPRGLDHLRGGLARRVVDEEARAHGHARLPAPAAVGGDRTHVGMRAAAFYVGDVQQRVPAQSHLVIEEGFEGLGARRRHDKDESPVGGLHTRASASGLASIRRSRCQGLFRIMRHAPGAPP